ncbi:MAG: hypothetical protein P4L51_21110 [Puia sp.]|nr:hypothetical protein [Puia sp.]
MRRIFTILCLLTATCTYIRAQDVTGVWQGHFRSSDLPQRYFADEARYKFEVQIAQHNKSLKAVTYSYQSTVFYGKADAEGALNPKTGKVLLQELKITEMRMQGSSDACIMTCFLQYSKSGNDEFLEGTYVSMNTRDSSNCGKGTVFLRRTATSDFYEEPFLVNKAKPAPHPLAHTPTPSAKPGSTPHPLPKPSTVAASPAKPAPKPADKPSDKSTAKTATKPADKPLDKTTDKTIAAKKKLRSAPTASVHTPVPRSKDGLTKITPVPMPAVHPTGDDTTLAGKLKDQARERILSTPTPQVLATRANQLVQSITLNTNDVVLNIYDDGAIDNDTISVYLDKKLIVSNARLTDQAIVVKLHLDENNDYHELVMVAENEGEIPPNTSLMIVKAGDKEYEVRITSTEQKNAVVVFQYEKNK